MEGVDAYPFLLGFAIVMYLVTLYLMALEDDRQGGVK